MDSDCGMFSGNPKTEWLRDPAKPDREMALLESFSYTDPEGRLWMAPAGSVINGASIPRPLWSIVGSPYTDDYREASVVHDVACATPGVSRRDADRMFYFACLAGGCPVEQARMLYLGVRIGAWVGETMGARAFPRGELLFRPEASAGDREKELLRRFRVTARKIGELDKDVDFSRLEGAVDEALSAR